MSNSTKQDKRRRGSERQKAFLQSISLKRSTAYRPAESPETNPSPVSVQLILCSSLSELLFVDFVTCSVDHDYSSLIISGEPNPDQLTSAWIALVSQYQVLTGSADAIAHVERSRKIESMNTQILHISCLYEALKLEYNSELAAELRESWSFNLPFTEETYQKDLQKVDAKLRNLKTKLEMALAAYRDEQKEEKESDGAMTREKYMQALYAIEESKKMEFDLEKLTTEKFATMYKMMVDRNKILKQKYSGNGTK